LADNATTLHTSLEESGLISLSGLSP
jgi:hypothetical protein